MKVIYMPIEPLEERYSKDWLKWTTEEFEKLQSDRGMDFSFETLLPESYEKIGEGAFLDCIGTNLFKAKQLEMAIDWIQKNRHGKNKLYDTVFYIQDGWFPGIEMLAYIRDALDLEFKIACCLHAGTWDEHDFITQKGMRKWGQDLEKSWLSFYDLIFVATYFHKQLILKNSGAHAHEDLELRIHKTGFPIFMPEFSAPSGHRKPPIDEVQVVFPHRLDQEKVPENFTALEKILQEKMPRFKCIRTQASCKTRDEYYTALSDSTYAVSFSLQETWGIAMQEAVLCGCIPIVPDRLSYQEMYPREFRYYVNPNGNYKASEVKEVMNKLEDFEHRYANGELGIIFDRRKGVANEILLRGRTALAKQVTLMQNLVNGQQHGLKV